MWFQLESDYRVLEETIGVVFVLMLQSFRNYWSGIYVNVTEC